MEIRSPSKFAAAAGVLGCLGLIFFHANELGQNVFGLTALQSRDLFWWPLLGVVLLYVTFVERRPLSSIGLKAPTWRTFISAVLVAGIWIFILAPLVNWIVNQLPALPSAPSAAGRSIQTSPIWYRVLLILRAAVGEEVLFRGFLIGRLRDTTGSRALAVAISLSAFTFAHLSFWGVAPLLAVATAGLLLSLLYLWRGDLMSNIFAHAIMDGVALLA